MHVLDLQYMYVLVRVDRFSHTKSMYIIYIILKENLTDSKHALSPETNWKHVFIFKKPFITAQVLVYSTCCKISDIITCSVLLVVRTTSKCTTSILLVVVRVSLVYSYAHMYFFI